MTRPKAKLIGGPFDGAQVQPTHWRTDTMVIGVWCYKHNRRVFYVLRHGDGDERVADFLGLEFHNDAFIRCRPSAGYMSDRAVKEADKRFKQECFEQALQQRADQTGRSIVVYDEHDNQRIIRPRTAHA